MNVYKVPRIWQFLLWSTAIVVVIGTVYGVFLQTRNWPATDRLTFGFITFVILSAVVFLLLRPVHTVEFLSDGSIQFSNVFGKRTMPREDLTDVRWSGRYSINLVIEGKKFKVFISYIERQNELYERIAAKIKG